MNTVDIVGCDYGDNGRNCSCHEICGHHIHVGDLVIFRSEIIQSTNGLLEEVAKAYLIRDGAQVCHIGFLPRRLLKHKREIVNRAYVIINDLRIDKSAHTRSRSYRNGGIVECRLVEEIEQHYRH